MKIFLPNSGNLGDTCNILPVLSGIAKSYGPIELVVRDKMKSFKGIKELFQAQECIKSFGFESECEFGVYEVLPLMNIEDRSLNRPWETQRYEQSAKENLKLGFTVDDDFILTVPNKKVPKTNKYIVGDRAYSQGADQRRMFDALRKSGKFPEEKCEYLDYNKSLIYNLNLIKKNPNPFMTTFTGISILADLMLKETMVFYPKELEFWDNKPIQYSFNQHFYRDRRTELIPLDMF